MKSSTPEKFKHKSRVEIRFVDVDAFGHVNNAHYLTYFEQARVHYFDDIVGWEYDTGKQGIILARIEINYVQPAGFKDQVMVETRCSRVGNKSLDLEYRMIKMERDKEILLADGVSVLVAFDYRENHSIEIPPSWKKAIIQYEGMNEN